MQHIKEKHKFDIILNCYYFPPHNNVGIRRVLFWANYYSSQGLNVLVITTKKKNSGKIYEVLNRDVVVVEYSAFSEIVVKNHIVTPTPTQKSESGVFYGLLRSFKRKVINKYVGQLLDLRLVPILLYSARVFFGRSVLKSMDLSKSIIVSTAPPWTIHLLAIFLSKKFKLSLVLDYRDPFSSNHMFSNHLSFAEKYIDKKMCATADHVLTVSPSWVEYYQRFNKNTTLVRNGYDNNIFTRGAGAINLYESGRLILNYFGSIEHPERLPTLILEYIESRDDVLINFYGSCSYVKEVLEKRPQLKSKVIIHGQIDYADCINLMGAGGINLIFETFSSSSLSHKGVIPTKVYEYIASGSPILAMISKELDMTVLLRDSGLCLGIVDSLEELNKVLSKDYIDSLHFNPNYEFIAKLSRQNSAKVLADILNMRLDNENI